MNYSKTLVASLIAGLAVVQAQAVTVDFNGGAATTEWSIGTSWSGGNVPGAGDEARLQFGDDATVTTATDLGTFNILQRNTATLAISANFKTVGTWNLGSSGDGNTSVTILPGWWLGEP